MSVVEDEDVSEHIATYTPDEPFAVEILPGATRGDLDFFNAWCELTTDAYTEGAPSR